jgi:hypothetical protein
MDVALSECVHKSYRRIANFRLAHWEFGSQAAASGNVADVDPGRLEGRPGGIEKGTKEEEVKERGLRVQKASQVKREITGQLRFCLY